MDMLFLKVLNMSISASWLVLIVLALRFVLKKAPRWLHVCLWALVAVRLICPVSIESVLSLIPSTETVPEEIFYMEPRQHDQTATLEILEERPNVESVDVELDMTVGVAQTRHIQWVLLWPAGMIAMLAYGAISYLRLKGQVSASIHLDNGVCICDYIDTPFILGIVKPKIYLPSAMEPASASHVLAHERAHIARKDHWWKPLGYGLLTIHWFNPLLWLAYILLCRDIELACDEKVIRDMELPQKKAYSEALLNCSVNRRIIAACPLAFGEVGVKERVKTVLNYKKPAFWIVLVAIIALIVTAVCFLTDPVQENKTDFPAEVMIQDGIIMEPYELSWIYWAQHMRTEYSATLRYADNGQSDTAQISYDGTAYTISDEAGKRTYQHCVKNQGQSEGGTIVEYFFLTDDPEMTAEKYLGEADILPTEVLHVDRRHFDAAESYGEVPESMETLLKLGNHWDPLFYCQNSLFYVRYVTAMSSVRHAYGMARVDYHGNLLCDFDIWGIPQRVLELEDGGFALFAASDADAMYTLSCYDETGNLRWNYPIDEDGSCYVPALYQRNGDIYCFGQVTPKDSSSDIFIWRISQDGELVQKLKIGGSDFDSIYRVLETKNGFTIYGSTQSGDGDLPFSKDGYGVGFRIEVSEELELGRAEKAETRYNGMAGYHNGNPVFMDDPILGISNADEMPENVHYGGANMFDWQDGYVVVRTLNYEEYTYNHPAVSLVLYYNQVVMTGYDANGNPSWQLAGHIRGG